MKVFPEDIVADFPLKITALYRTLITEMDYGKEYRRKKWRFPKRIISLTYPHLSSVQADTLLNFYKSVKGAYEAFYFFDWLPHSWEDEFVGRGDGTLITFDLPGKEIEQETLKVYIDGTETTDYTFSAGTGENGEDQIVFSLAPAVGALITADFTGKIRLKVRFEDNLNRTLSRYKNENITLKLYEVR